jgi:hypothetical protein
MAGQSKRTTAPMPVEFPWPTGQLVRPPMAPSVPPPISQPVQLPAIPSMFAPGVWLPPCPPQSMAGSSAQGAWWTPPSGSGYTTQPTAPAGNLDEYDLQTWFLVDSLNVQVMYGAMYHLFVVCL